MKLDNEGRTPEQAAAFKREQARRASVSRLVGTLRGRGDLRTVGGFDRTKRPT